MHENHPSSQTYTKKPFTKPAQTHRLTQALEDFFLSTPSNYLCGQTFLPSSVKKGTTYGDSPSLRLDL